MKMCSTNTAVALNKYVIANKKELRKLLKMEKMEILDNFYLVI